MAATIPEPRLSVANSAPKIVSMEIPIDKIGEVIGPKGKVINTLQQETGADIAVDDDGVVGTVTIGAKDGNAVEEARRRISLILDPPTAEVGVVYPGKVVNITKFGAFVNVLPGRDGLLHISKLSSLAGGKRVNNVEDVLTLGQAVEVRVDDIDPQGKVSLSLASAPEGAASSSSGNGDRGDRSDRGDRGDRSDRGDRGHSSHSAPAGAGGDGPSFEDAFEAELVAELGDLGPGGPVTSEDAGRGDRGGDRGGDRRPRSRSRRR
jgi:polyribonucleotide nucleotidyltransferase